MEKRYLESLQNLAYSFVELVEEMKNKTKEDEKEKSSTFELFKNYGKLGGTLKIISKGIAKLKEDNKKILSNQDTLMALTKEIKEAKEKKNIFGKLSDRKESSQVKDGVKTIVVIAAGIMAIGLAFKLIGTVDFTSVMALSLALPLLAFAFVEIAKQKELKGKEVFTILGVMIGISAAVWLSSLFLGMIQPLSLMQLVTAIGIAATFAVIGYGVGKLAKDLNSVSFKSLLMLPIALVLISTAIMASSYILAMTSPISASTMMDVIITSASIAAASLIMFIPIWLYSKLDAKTILTGSLGLIAVAGAIMVSSILLSYGNYTNAPPIAWSLGVGLSLLVFSPAIIILGLIAANGGASALLAGAVAVIGLAAVLTASSIILALGNYSTYPSLDWALGVGASMIGFGLAVVALGFIAISGVGAVALLAGAAAVLGLSAVLVASSAILAQGNYSKYPSAKWSLGVGGSILGFGIAAAALGAIILTGIGAAAIALGVITITKLAQSLVDIDILFKKGEFKKYPSLDWAQGVSKALATVGSVLSDMGIGGIFKNFLGDLLGTGPVDLAQKMVDIDAILAQGQFIKYPPITWAEGVAKSMLSIGNVLSNMGIGGIFKNVLGSALGTGPVDLARKIVEIDSALSKGKYDKYPTADWSKGTLASLTSMSSLYSILNDADLTNVDKINPVKLATASTSLLMLASAYDKLAYSIGKLNSNIMNLQQNQLDSLRMVTGNIISLSIIDSDNFDKIMDKLTEKSADLKDLYKDLSLEYSLSSGSTIKPNGGKAKGGNLVTPSIKSQDMSIKDLYDKLDEMNSQLMTIANNSGNLSSYVNELRASGDVTLQH